MQVTIILADAAQVSENKLMMIGGNWSSFSGKGPSAVALIIDAPWDQTNLKRKMHLQLFDADGQPVFVAGSASEVPMQVSADLEFGRPPGIPRGISQTVSIAITIGAMNLRPGTLYVWKCRIDDHPVAERSFFCPPETTPLTSKL